MPPLTYNAWRDPTASTIAELMARRGDIEARRAESVAAAQANAAQARGQAWSGAIRSIGDVVGGALNYAAEAPQRKLAEERGRLEMDEARAAAADRTKAREDRATLQSAQSSGLDPEQVKAQLQQLGRGDLVPIYEKANGELEASRLSLRNLRQQVEAADNDYFGTLALNIKRANFDPIAIEWALSEAERDGHDVAAIRQGLQRDPSQLRTMVDGLIGKSPSAQKALEAEAEERRREEAAAIAKDANTRANMTAMETAANTTRDNQRADAQLAETIRANRANEAIQAGAVTARQATTTQEATEKAQAAERTTQALRDQAATTIGEIDRLLTLDKNGTPLSLNDAAAGIVGGSRVLQRQRIPGTAWADAEASLNRVRSRTVVDLIAAMKSQSATGATGLGAMSDPERVMLQQAAARLDAAQTEGAMFEALKEIRSVAQKITGSGVMVNMTSPDGRSLRVPAEQVDEARRRGATVVGQ